MGIEVYTSIDLVLATNKRGARRAASDWGARNEGRGSIPACVFQGLVPVYCFSSVDQRQSGTHFWEPVGREGVTGWRGCNGRQSFFSLEI